ncbi:hypothetical protein PUN28_009748 [Cardiocondyla obscurior]|uniref:Uncharacterized protein n=1 Tax=Cardiocondyla obscurior TaxID=286306 RepID=A0AAW2FNT6_9HYME
MRAVTSVDAYVDIFSSIFAKNKILTLQHSIVRHLKQMHSGLFRPLFSSEAEIWPKNEKNILKFYNIALCGIQNRYGPIWSHFIFIRSRDMAKKRKEIFLKFNNIALCGIQNRCIWD